MAANSRFWKGKRTGLPYMTCVMNTTAPQIRDAWNSPRSDATSPLPIASPGHLDLCSARLGSATRYSVW
jgi:hypothetical protein